MRKSTWERNTLNICFVFIYILSKRCLHLRWIKSPKVWNCQVFSSASVFFLFYSSRLPLTSFASLHTIRYSDCLFLIHRSTLNTIQFIFPRGKRKWLSFPFIFSASLISFIDWHLTYLLVHVSIIISLIKYLWIIQRKYN